jgi:hypothetical protein
MTTTPDQPDRLGVFGEGDQMAAAQADEIGQSITISLCRPYSTAELRELYDAVDRLMADWMGDVIVTASFAAQLWNEPPAPN